MHPDDAESEGGWRNYLVWCELLCHGQVPRSSHSQGPQELHRQPQGICNLHSTHHEYTPVFPPAPHTLLLVASLKTWHYDL